MDQRGVILPLTLIILLVLATMVAALLAMGVYEPQIAANVTRSTQALSLAEAGAERGIAYFGYDATGKTLVNDACGDGDTCPGTATALWSNVSMDTGTYTVTWTPVSFATVLIESTGRTSSGTIERIVRIAVTKHYSSQYGLLGDKVEVKGSGRVIGNQGAIHGNNETKISNSALVQKSATTTSTGTCDGCAVACNVANCSTLADPPANAKGVGLDSESGNGGPTADFPRSPVDPNQALRPYDYLDPTKGYDFTNKPAVLFGGKYSADGTQNVPAPARCAPTTSVPEKEILVVTSSGCTRYWDPTDNSPPAGVSPLPSSYGNWKMKGHGQWELSGNTTPPEGLYYAPRRIEVAGNPGGTGTAADEFANAWKATLIAGSPLDEGRIELKGNTTVKPYLNDVLSVSGEFKGTGSSLLKGTIIGTAPGDGAGACTDACSYQAGDGKVELQGNALKLRGNVISNGKANSESEVKYQVPSRSRLLRPKLLVLSWTTN